MIVNSIFIHEGDIMEEIKGLIPWDNVLDLKRSNEIDAEFEQMIGMLLKSITKDILEFGGSAELAETIGTRYKRIIEERNLDAVITAVDVLYREYMIGMAIDSYNGTSSVAFSNGIKRLKEIEEQDKSNTVLKTHRKKGEKY